MNSWGVPCTPFPPATSTGLPGFFVQLWSRSSHFVSFTCGGRKRWQWKREWPRVTEKRVVMAVSISSSSEQVQPWSWSLEASEILYWLQSLQAMIATGLCISLLLLLHLLSQYYSKQEGQEDSDFLFWRSCGHWRRGGCAGDKSSVGWCTHFDTNLNQAWSSYFGNLRWKTDAP